MVGGQLTMVMDMLDAGEMVDVGDGQVVCVGSIVMIQVVGG